MKITFEGRTILDVTAQMESMLAAIAVKPLSTRHLLEAAAAADRAEDLQRSSPDIVAPVENPVDIPVEKPVKTFMDMPPPAAKPKRERTEKQRENDERLRVAAKTNFAAKNFAAKAKAAAKVAADKTAKTVSDPMVPEIPPPPKSAEGMDPAEVVKIRVKTIEELQAAYANGFQKEVFELLARFGNGAKSFRELPVEAFVPIREAIDNGALT